MAFEIEKGIEVPLGQSANQLPVKNMEVGDSLLLPKKLVGSLNYQIKQANFEPKRKFVRRSMDEENFRVWRTE